MADIERLPRVLLPGFRGISMAQQAAREGKALWELWDEILSGASEAEKKLINDRLAEISEHFGSEGP